MFRLRPDADPPDDRRHPSRDARSWCPLGASAAAAVLAAGFRSIRETPVEGCERGPYCMMGICFDCLAEIDGVPNRQSCMVEARPGMRIRRQIRARKIDPAAAMTVELAIVGAGPAGMAAAILAAELGVETVLDRRARLRRAGRSIARVERARPNSPLGPDYLAGRDLAAALRASRVEYRPNTTLWHIDPDGTLYLESDGRSETLTARRILLATGAFERPVPIPGWTLPGVMAVGAAQILLKSADLVPEGRAVLAGQGPLLYLLAAQLARAGAPPVALLETTPVENYLAAARSSRQALAGPPAVGERIGTDACGETRRHSGPARGARAACNRTAQSRARRLGWRRTRRRSSVSARRRHPERPGEPRPAAAPRLGREPAVLAAGARPLGANEPTEHRYRR